MITNNIFTEADVEAIERVENCRSSDFCELVAAAGLDPQVDLRNTNLRGVDLRGCNLLEFDLSGCDLSGALVSKSTVLPPKEKLVGAKVEFVEANDVTPIVQTMLSIETALPSERKRLLDTLLMEYDSDAHIDRFVLNTIARTKSAEVAIDLFQCLSAGFIANSEKLVLEQVKRIFLIEVKKPYPKKKVGAKNSYTFLSGLIGWIAENDFREWSDLAIAYRSGSISLIEFSSAAQSIK
jgi:hypothetical protein